MIYRIGSLNGYDPLRTRKAQERLDKIAAMPAVGDAVRSLKEKGVRYLFRLKAEEIKGTVQLNKGVPVIHELQDFSPIEEEPDSLYQTLFVGGLGFSVLGMIFFLRRLSL